MKSSKTQPKPEVKKQKVFCPKGTNVKVTKITKRYNKNGSPVGHVIFGKLKYNLLVTYKCFLIGNRSYIPKVRSITETEKKDLILNTINGVFLMQRI
jgi:hypothetical protein